MLGLWVFLLVIFLLKLIFISACLPVAFLFAFAQKVCKNAT